MLKTCDKWSENRLKVLNWWFNRLGTPLAIITGKKVGKKVAGTVAVERIFPCFIFFFKSLLGI